MATRASGGGRGAEAAPASLVGGRTRRQGLAQPPSAPAAAPAPAGTAAPAPGRQRLTVFLHHSIPAVGVRSGVWGSRLAHLGLRLTRGAGPEPGTRLAVVGFGGGGEGSGGDGAGSSGGGGGAFDPFSAEAEDLLFSLRRSAAAAVTPAAAAGALSPGVSPNTAAAAGARHVAAATVSRGTSRSPGPSGPRPTGSGGSAGGSGSGSGGGGRAGDGGGPATVSTSGSGAGAGGGGAGAGTASAAAAAAAVPEGGVPYGEAVTRTWSDPDRVRLVGEGWLTACARRGTLLDPAPYDVRQERPKRTAAAEAEAQGLHAADAAAAVGPGADGAGGFVRPSKRRRLPPGVAEAVAAAVAAERAQRQRNPAAANRGAAAAAAALRGLPQGGEGSSDDGAPAAGGGESGAEAAGEQPCRGAPAAGPEAAPPPRRWVAPRLAPQPGAAVLVPLEPQPLGWWDPCRGAFVPFPDHTGRPRPQPSTPAAPVPEQRLEAVPQLQPQYGPAVRVVSYNVLGNTACMTSGLAAAADPAARALLDMSYRGPRLLQEVDASVFQLWLQPWADAEEYEALYLPRGGTRLLGSSEPAPPPRFQPFPPSPGGGGRKRRRQGAGGGGGRDASSSRARAQPRDQAGPLPNETDGVAVLVRRAALEVVAARCEELASRAVDDGSPLWPSLRHKGVVGLLVLLRHRGGQGGQVQAGEEVGGGAGAAAGSAGAGAGAGPDRKTDVKGTAGGNGGSGDGGGGGGGRGGGGEFLVAATHLWWDPRLPDVKAAQAALLCAAAADFLRSRGPPEESAPVVLCGDLNTRWAAFGPSTYDKGVSYDGCLVGGVYELLSQGSLPPAHPHHPVARLQANARVSLDTAGLCLASALFTAQGREPPLTVCTRTYRDCLDYIWVSRGRWAITAVLDMPYTYGSDPRLDGQAAGEDARAGSDARESEEGLGAEGGRGGFRGDAVGARSGARPVRHVPPIPDASWPSDHLAIGVELRLVGTAGGVVVESGLGRGYVG
ncbi:hypothetical protein HYH03_009213 [Edaphochlamys debaryana]|uniref:Endonuclease/exonuclease/phosphatase domain-containing protein n=1 Tax=Edaphochlamys debaryana TaxID=47281 RepID=A0A836BXH6_9CHLO|nr:hypothetical protein HYH03_009213 [Edaphochlamys debaryana]|eukprot:KAG2492550.1 hypothetical protein HYH03_009213 [Edaphochlamys debaryana]